MKKIIKYLILTLLFLLPLNIKADCDYETLSNLKTISQNVMFNYDYKIVKQNDDKYKTAKFTITISNIYDAIYVYDTLVGKYYNYNDSSKTPTIIKTSNFDNGLKLEFQIFAKKGVCKGSLLKTDYVVLPSYNIYYGDKLCKGIEDYNLCQKWQSVTMSYADFEKNIEIYKKSLVKEPEESEEPSIEEKIYTYVMDFIASIWINYYYIFLPIIIVVCLFVIIRKIKKDSFGF